MGAFGVVARIRSGGGLGRAGSSWGGTLWEIRGGGAEAMGVEEPSQGSGAELSPTGWQSQQQSPELELAGTHTWGGLGPTLWGGPGTPTFTGKQLCFRPHHLLV